MRIYARMRQRLGELRLGVLVFGLIGVVFLTIGAVLMVYGFSFRKSAVKVPATIMEITVFASSCGVFVLVGLVMLIRQGKRSRQERRLVAYGHVESVPITDILLADNVWIQSPPPIPDCLPVAEPVR